MPLPPRRLAWIGAAASVAFLIVVVATVAGLSPTTSTAQREFDLSKVAAEVTAITPATGSLAGGDIVTVSGQGLSAVTEVTFGGQPAPVVTVNDSTSVTVVVPTGSGWTSGAGVDVDVRTASGSVSDASTLSYTYTAVSAVDRQLEYALAHWNNYNLESFGDLNPVGGDCMNFVSQTLLARGWSMTDDWYSYDGGENWSDSWGHVPSFDSWLRAHPEYGATTLELNQRDQVKLGDLVVFDWNNNDSLDHIQIVSSITEVDGVISIGMVGHNLDSDYRDLDTVITVDHPGAIGYFWSIP